MSALCPQSHCSARVSRREILAVGQARQISAYAAADLDANRPSPIVVGSLRLTPTPEPIATLQMRQVGDLKSAGAVHLGQYEQMIQAGRALGRPPLVSKLIKSGALVVRSNKRWSDRARISSSNRSFPPASRTFASSRDGCSVSARHLPHRPNASSVPALRFESGWSSFRRPEEAIDDNRAAP